MVDISKPLVTVVIVDLMNLLVRAWHAGEPSKVHAVRSLLITCANVIQKLKPEYLIFAADGGHVARSAALPSYKSHRPPKPQELIDQIALAEEAIAAIGWPLIRVDGWEADDVIATLSQLASVNNGKLSECVVAICSSDKDLFQLLEAGKMVYIYQPWDGGKVLLSMDVEVKYGVKQPQFLDYMALVGDASDGIPGVKGIGPKKAAALINSYGDLDSILEASHFIKGAIGQSLRNHAADARLSRKLVELNRDLDIPGDWNQTRAFYPKPDWIESLRSLGLGQAATRLADVLTQPSF